MLRTLFLEEARALGRAHLVIAGVMAMVAGLMLVLGLLSVPVLGSLVLPGAALVFYLIPVVVFAHLGVAYWQSMYGARGYLTMTVPVRGRVVFAAKVLYAIAALCVAGLVMVAGLGLTAVVAARRVGITLAQYLTPLREVVNTLGLSTVILIVLAVVLMVISWVLIDAALMSIGAESRWNHLGFGAPVVGFVIVYLVTQVMNLVAMLLIPVSLDLTTGRIVVEPMLSEFLEALRTDSDPTLLGLGFVPTLWLLAAGMAWWAVRSIERRTSLR